MSPVRTRTGRITRLRSHPLLHHLFYTPKAKKKSRHPANASRIAKMLRRGHGAASTPTNRQENMHSEPAANLRRSMRKRRIPANLGYDSESDPEDCFQVRRAFRSSNSAAKNETKSSQDEQNEEDVVLPRREGLRPRRGKRIMRHDFSQDSEEDEQASSEGADREDEAADDPEVRDGDGEVRGERGREDREEEEDEEGEEREGRRRYALRNRTEVQRFSPQMEERVIHARPIAKSFQFKAGIKRNRDGKRVGSRSDKRHRSSRADDSDDSLLIDEMTHVPGAPWLRAGSSSGHPPLLFGGLDMSGFSNRGLNIAATGWGHQADHLGGATPGTGVQTTGLSHKGGADIQPVQVDESIGFDQVGGLSGYIQSLKEMVFFPLLYPKFFEIYGITPPRGVLLCGPPGTGKTLIARALASSASRAGQRVNFYMRKGADVLSKWVGEAERQLRMLFEEAQRNQPSIIFFDEIDGLAPVRSSKQEQIHNSIVSTLLALMDGLDARGQVVIIGATNRIDAIDGALRRPGRFDRELVFSLPDCKARAEILDIHTRKWQDCPSEDLRRELAAACVGYCGADLKALCTEAAIRAFRKKYPQVYTSDDQLLIDVDAVKVKKQDFFEAMSTITPAAQRGALVHSMPLSMVVCSCLERQLKRIMEIVEGIFPLSNNEQGISIADDDEDCDQLATLSTLRFGSSFPFVYRPRLLLCGKEGAGLEHLGPAVLHELERFPVHSLSLPSLLSDMGSRTPEEALVNIFREARRTIPAILYLPQLELWWETAHTQLRTVFLMLLAELPSNLPVLLLATSKVNRDELDEQAANIFGSYIYELGWPRAEDRAKFFSRLLDTALAISNEKHESKDKQETLPELPRAPKKERGMSEAELQAQADEEQHALRRLRMCLREVCNRLLYEKCFSVFHYPVMVEDAPDYHATVTNPMDVATLLQNVDSGHYLTRSAFLQDLELIPINAKAYHGDDYNGARIVSKAYALRDAAHGILSQMDKELVAQCDAIATRGGPIRLSGDGTPGLTNPTVSQPAHVTRASARLRGFQPEIDVSQTYEVHLRRSKRISDGDHAGEAGIVSNGATQNVAVLSRSTEPMTELLAKETVSPARSGSLPQMSQLEEIDVQGGELSVQLITEQEKEHLRTCMVGVDTTTKSDTFLSCNLESDEKAPKESHETQCRSSPSSPKNDKYAQRIDRIKRKFVRYTKGHGISGLERLHADVCQTVRRQAGSFDTASVVKYLEEFVGILKSKADAGKCDEDSKS